MENNKFVPSAGDEAANSYERRKFLGYFDTYFSEKKSILDVGCGHNPVVPHATPWDLANGDGDATYLEGVGEESYDTVYASHLLEHLEKPSVALERWWQVVKTGGHLMVVVPDEDLYEQGIWPSVFNSDHRNSFTTWKNREEAPPHSLSLLELVMNLPNSKLISLSICDKGYDYGKLKPQKPVDQCGAERQIELILEKSESVKEYYSSMQAKVRCGCGSDDLQLLGVVVPDRIWSKCNRCGQRGFMSTKGS